MGYALGVDLGTTYSAAATAEGERVEILELGSRSATVPSVVYLREDGEMLVGESAVRRGASDPARVARETKRRLGDPTPLIIGGSPFSAESILAEQLRAIVRDATREKGAPPDAIVLTHPASYGPYKLDQMRQVIDQADVGAVELLPEPVAAALHYASQERIEPGTVVAVYDLGGGTFDAAVLRKSADGFEILGDPKGLDRLGGVDFDQAVFAHVASSIGPGAMDAAAAADPGTIARLRDEARDAKESLSQDTDATIPVLLPDRHTEVRLTRTEFEQMIEPRIRETIGALERSVRSAGLTFEGIDRILLVGGSSRIPLVGQMVRDATGRPVSRDANPKHAIALGAARHASRMTRPTAQPATSVGALPAPLPATFPDMAPPAAASPVPAPMPAAAPMPPPATYQPAVASAPPPRPRRRMPIFAGLGLVVAVAVVIAAAAFALSAQPGRAAEITSVTWNGSAYQVAFNTRGFAPTEGGDRVHFYWNTLPESQAASSATRGQWLAWWGASPILIDGTNRPAQAGSVCVVVVNAASEVLASSGNCFQLPA